MKIKHLCYFITFLLFMVPCLGYFYHVEEMIAPDGNHTVYLLSDFHGHNLDLIGSLQGKKYEEEVNEKKKTCDQQRIDLLEIVNRMNGCVIAEDMAFNHNNKLAPELLSISDQMKAEFDQDFICFDPNKKVMGALPDVLLLQRDELNEALSPLVLLTQFCHKQGIFADNIEFRFMDRAYKVAGYLKYHNMILDKAKRYKDGDHLNVIYSEKISEFESRHEKWSKLLHDSLFVIGNDATIEQVINEFKIQPCSYGICTYKVYTGDTKFDYLNGAFDSFIDLRILHSIHNLIERFKHIFVCAGGVHIDHTKAYLEHLGYKMKQPTGEKTSLYGCIPNGINLAYYFKK